MTIAAQETIPALKEWSAAIHALLDGRQTVLLRKGGIHEKRFAIPDGVDAATDFALFPTVAHSHAQRVRPEHRELLAPSAPDSTEDHLVVRAMARVVAAVEVQRPDALPDIADLHIWTDESVRDDRVDFRPKHRLTVLVVAVAPLPQPVRLPRVPDYAGCTSWVQLPVATPSSPRWVHDQSTLDAVAHRVRECV